MLVYAFDHWLRSVLSGPTTQRSVTCFRRMSLLLWYLRRPADHTVVPAINSVGREPRVDERPHNASPVNWVTGHKRASVSIAKACQAGVITLAIGIGLQNFPEGIAVAVPLRGAGMHRLRAFMYGQLAASLEPVTAVLGAALTLLTSPALPYALGGAAGAMIFVVIEELIPAHTRTATTTGPPSAPSAVSPS